MSFAARVAKARMVVVGVAAVVVSEAVRRIYVVNEPLRANRDDLGATTSFGDSERADNRAPARPDDWADELAREMSELATLADQIYGIAQFARHEDEVGEDTFVRLDDLRWLLGNYVLKGARIRRLAQLPNLLKSLGVECKNDSAGVDISSAAAELLSRIRDTNSVTVDWLLTHRVALPDPDFLDSNALMDRYNRLEIEPMTVSGDPLYLLTCHIHDMLETIDSLGADDHSLLDRLEAQLAKPVIAVENEIQAAMAFNIALLGTAPTVARTSEAV